MRTERQDFPNGAYALRDEPEGLVWLFDAHGSFIGAYATWLQAAHVAAMPR